MTRPPQRRQSREPMRILEIAAHQKKSEICNQILRALPLWFGIESAIVDYVNDVQPMKTWAVFDGEQAIGFASIKQHFRASAEIHVMGILEKYHRQGVGHELVKAIETDLRKSEIKFLIVKTLSESRPNLEYDRTRHFYLKTGFEPLEEFKTLWGEANPCLMLVKAL
jgi:N-acetylglutamate synthase-like GNAT family acetyltransferase